MKNILTRYSISWTITGVIIAFSAFASIWVASDQIYSVSRNIEDEVMRDLRHELSSMQSTISDNMMSGDAGKAHRALTGMSSHSYIRALFLVDENDLIILSTRFEWIGKKGIAVGVNYDPGRSSSVRYSMRSDIGLTIDGNDATGYFPIPLEVRKGEIRPARIGMLFVDHDMRELKQEARYQAAVSAAKLWVPFAVLITVLWIILRKIVSKRLEIVSSQADVITNGDISARSKIDGSDEIASLSRSINMMADSLAEERLKLLSEISKKEVMEEELRKSEELYRSIVNSAGIGISLISPNMEIISLNNQMRSWFPHIDAEKRPICYKEFNMPPREEICSYCPTAKTLQDGQVHESVTETPDGDKVRNYRIISSPIKDRDGKVVAAIELVDDITEQLKAREDLNKFQRAIEHTADSVVITDPSGKIEYVNPSFTHTTGYTSTEALGQNPRILKSGVTPDIEYRKMWETISSGGDWHGIFHNRKKDGTLYWESAAISPIKNSAGEITHYVAVKQDITERMKAEEELKKKERLSILGQVVGSMAHDLRNPLNTIHLAAEVLSIHNPDAEKVTKECIESIKSETMAAEEIISSLLDSVRTKTPNLTPVSAAELVDLSLKRCNIPQKINLSIDIAPSLPQLLLDPLQMKQVLINLINNSVQAMPGGGDLTISAGVDGNNLTLSISDTGGGILPQNLERLFQPLFTTKKDGTGLGLIVVKNLTEANRGKIEVKSEVGKGTTFMLTFPVEG